jgi:TRAP-type C4-dicarboxylate transport system permease small subunit
MFILRRTERVFLVSLFLGMVTLFTLNVVARELGGTFASQLAWIEEAVRLMNIFLVFGALGLALEKGKHVGIDTLRDALPERYRNIIRRVIDAVGCIFTAYMAYLGYQLVIFVLNTGQRSPTLDIPMGWIYMAPVVGFGLLSLRYALSFIGTIQRFTGYDDSNGDAEAEANIGNGGPA